MRESILNGKSILAVDVQPHVLLSLEEEIRKAAPKCKFEKATTYQEATQKLESRNYDVAILDTMGVRGSDLLDLAVKRNLRVAMLTGHGLNPSFERKARAFLYKEKSGEIVPFLEDIFNYEYLPGWKHIFRKMERFLAKRFEHLKELIDDMSLYPERRL